MDNDRGVWRSRCSLSERRTDLSSLISAIRRVLQRSLQSALTVTTSKELPDLASKCLDIGRRHWCNGGRERAEVEVGGGFGVEGVNVDRAPVERRHGGNISVRDARYLEIQGGCSMVARGHCGQ